MTLNRNLKQLRVVVKSYKDGRGIVRIVKVYIWLPTGCVNPFGKGAYGHVALEFPQEQENERALYISLNPGGEVTNFLKCSYDGVSFKSRPDDFEKYNTEAYEGHCINIEFNNTEVQNMYQELGRLLGNYRPTDDVDDNNIAIPDVILGNEGLPSVHFRFWRNPFSRKFQHNCTSFVESLLESGGLKLPITKPFFLFTFLFNLFNPIMVGYTVGVLSELCYRCQKQPDNTEFIEGFSFAAAVFMLLSFTATFIANFLTSACQPKIFRANSNFFFIASVLCFISNIGCRLGLRSHWVSVVLLHNGVGLFDS